MLSDWKLRLRALFKRTAVEQEIDDELRFHFDRLVESYIAKGFDQAEAVRRARFEFGGVDQVKEQYRDHLGVRLLEDWWRDVRLASRTLRATPLVTCVAILSMTLGIGANTAIFTIINSLVLKPLPVTDPERLVRLSTSTSNNTGGIYSFALFDQIRRHTDQFDGVLAYACCKRGALAIGGLSESVDQMLVSDDFFTTLGLRPHLGRLFSSGDDLAGGGPAGPKAVISFSLWRRLGGDAQMIGRSITIDRVLVTVIGVTPAPFFGVEVGRTFDVALPIHTQPVLDPAKPQDDHLPFLNIWLRLRPDASLVTAAAALRGVQPQIRVEAMPSAPPSSDWLEDPFTLQPAASGTSALRDRFERPVLALFVLVVLVLFIACANLANLLLARGIARNREMSLRLSLGATRRDLVRQLVAESLVLAIAGAVGGLIFGRWASRVLAMQLSTVARVVSLDLSIDWHVIGFAVTAVVVTVLICGVAPAVRSTRVDPMDALKDHSRPIGRGSGRLSHGVLVAQVAMSLVLVVAAGLFVRTFERLAHVSLGFDRDQVLVATVTPSTVPASERNPFYHQLVRAVTAVPGVAHAGGSLNPPLIGTIGGAFVVSLPGSTPPPDAERISQFTEVTPGWFDAYGIGIRAGRDFDDHDTAAADPVMIVNEAFVHRILQRRHTVGTTLTVTHRFPPLGDIPFGPKTIVGIVGNSAYRSIRDIGQPTIYFPLAQRKGPLHFESFFITLRSTAGSPALLTRQVGKALTDVNPNLTLTFRPVAEQVRDSLAQDRVIAMLSGFFGALALLLAGVGIYGVTSYAVTRQRSEIGLRLALGATPSSVLRRVLFRLAAPIAVGAAIGGATSLWASTFVGALTYGLEPHDPVTLLGATCVLGIVAALAAWFPAWRAARIDLASVLREG